MSELKCYNVSITVEALVVAQSAEKAREIGNDALSDELALIDCAAFDVDLAQSLPPSWDNHCLVYHEGKEDLDAGTALKLNKEHQMRASHEICQGCIKWDCCPVFHIVEKCPEGRYRPEEI